MPTNEAPPALPLRHAAGWGSGALGQAIAVYVFAVLLLRYLTDSVGIAAALAGTVIAASKLFDGLVDPMIGAASDRTRGRLGRRAPWMLAGGLLLGAAAAFLLNVPPALDAGGRLGWVAAGLVAYSLGYACFSIPWIAMPAEMTDDYHGRSTMMSWRVASASLGQAIAAGLAGWLLIAARPTAGDYGRLGLVLGAVAAAAMLATVVLLRGARATTREPAARPRPLAQLGLILSNRPFMVLIGMKLVGFIAATMQTGSMAYFTRYVLRVSDAWLSSFYLLLTVGMIASQPVWLRISRRVDKRQALSVALALQAVFYLTLSLGLIDPVGWLLAHGLLLGLCVGGTYLLTQSMLPDTLEYDYQRTGMRREGALAGVGAFIEKCSSALGIATLGLVLSAGGYVASAGAAVAQPAGAILAIRIGTCFLPAAMLVCALLMLQYYRLDRQALEAGRAGG